MKVTKTEYKIYKYRKNSLLISTKPSYIFLLVITVIWFLFQNLQALKVMAYSLEPWFMGLPFSLFTTWVISMVLTISIYWVSKKWGKSFSCRVTEELGEEEN